MSVDLEELNDPHYKADFSRANGAPMIVDREGKRVRFSRPSNYAKPLDDESALTNWRIDTACIGVAKHRDLQARYVALDPSDRSERKVLREEATKAGRGSEGADTGTAIHKMTDRWEHEPDWEPPEPYLSQLRAYSAEMERLGLRSVFFEQPIVNLDYRAAGTMDRIYELTRELITPHGEILAPGTLLVGDTKTTRNIEYSYPSYAAQMAIYAGGEFYDVVNDTFLDTPAIAQSWAIIMHIPSDGTICEAQWVDLEVGRWGCYLAQQVKAWRNKWRSGEHSCPAVIVDDRGPQPYTDADWLSENAEWCSRRLQYISEHSEARMRLSILWPSTIAPKAFKAGEVSVSDMLEGMKLLDRIEAEFELGFVEGQPSRGTHRSQITNQPPSAKEA